MEREIEEAIWSKKLYDKMRYDVSNGFTKGELIEWYGKKNTETYLKFPTEWK